MKTFMKSKWHVAHGRSIDIGSRSVIMGILNVTPDSFSDGGHFLDSGKAVEQALKMVQEGATIIDIGGESVRPGYQERISQEEEERRVMPVIKRLVRETDAILCIDTSKEKTASFAIDEGVHIINDVYSFQRSPNIVNVAAKKNAGLVVMRTARERKRLADIVDDQKFCIANSLRIAKDAGVSDEHIVIDPGFGFHEDIREDMDLLSHFEELLSFHYPLLVGISRKRIIASISGFLNARTDIATAGSSVFLRSMGASIFRVHNVALNREALCVVDAVLSYCEK